ncbi:hypothetical protein K458DRAFT_69569 [Lentithecium fluviatile CBS 122367]|uniref:Uncharacterized protein n=1 Tax=Lentithecium fluviatile CBS 122367 TaxID=1168545 RepID=A0A6G1JM16_9PLEO|nr:hypothetical protein K458DRAFT_69569 [Lentithecium fluviatile CBS 122367]
MISPILRSQRVRCWWVGRSVAWRNERTRRRCETGGDIHRCTMVFPWASLCHLHRLSMCTIPWVYTISSLDGRLGWSEEYYIALRKMLEWKNTAVSCLFACFVVAGVWYEFSKIDR